MVGATRKARTPLRQALVLVPALALAALLAGCNLWTGEFTGRVTRVLHGDTLKIQKPSGRIVRVVLAGVDCPERGQPYRKEARKLAIRLAQGKQVTVKAQGRNRYGHIVAVVVLPGGRILNRELVQAGLAWVVPGYEGDPKLADLERRARRLRKGLWRDDDPVPPWEFQRNKSWRSHRPSTTTKR